MATVAFAVVFSVLVAPSAARADDSSCGFASGNGYVCTYVAGNGTWVEQHQVHGVRPVGRPGTLHYRSLNHFSIPTLGVQSLESQKIPGSLNTIYGIWKGRVCGSH
jgi:hypothetical protein